jgi:hypothetical protein
VGAGSKEKEKGNESDQTQPKRRQEKECGVAKEKTESLPSAPVRRNNTLDDNNNHHQGLKFSSIPSI